MDYNRILTIQDISCLSQCSLTVALPIISAFGIETCILPSAILSTHTAFKGFTLKDLTEEFKKIIAHWEKEKIKFNAFYIGYLLNKEQINITKEIFNKFDVNNTSLKIIDPVMGDNGKLYTGFDLNFAQEMKSLCYNADVILPNLTEACFLTGYEYKEKYDEKYISNLIKKLEEFKVKIILLTGICYDENTTGVIIVENGKTKYYKHRKISKSCFGTGDIYASIFVGAYLKGMNAFDAACAAADFVVECIEYTVKDTSHWYGVKFEPLLANFIIDLKNKYSIK
jgi:pyridoxine kinase